MKKFIICLAVIFALSAVVCAFTGAAIGGRLVRKLYDNRDKLPAFADRIEEAIEGRIDFDGVEDYFDGDSDEDMIELCQGEMTAELAEGQSTLRIYAQTGKVKLRTADDGVLRAEFSVRSDNPDIPEDFRLEGTEDADISFTHEGELHHGNYDIELTVYIPADFGGTADVRVDAGELSLKDIKLDGITVKLDAGSVKLKNAEVRVSDITVNTGELEIGREFLCGESFKGTVGTGEAEIELPFANSFSLEYNVKTGAAKLDGIDGGSVTLSPGSTPAGGTVKTVTEDEVSAHFVINVDTGSIDF